MPAQRDIDRHLERLATALAGSELRWAIAESCTGGQLAASGRIPIQAIIASIEADDALASQGV